MWQVLLRSLQGHKGGYSWLPHSAGFHCLSGEFGMSSAFVLRPGEVLQNSGVVFASGPETALNGVHFFPATLHSTPTPLRRPGTARTPDHDNRTRSTASI